MGAMMRPPDHSSDKETIEAWIEVKDAEISRLTNRIDRLRNQIDALHVSRENLTTRVDILERNHTQANPVPNGPSLLLFNSITGRLLDRIDALEISRKRHEEMIGIAQTDQQDRVSPTKKDLI